MLWSHNAHTATVQPAQPWIDNPILSVQAARPWTDNPILSVQPARPWTDNPILSVQPARPWTDNPILSVQPAQSWTDNPILSVQPAQPCIVMCSPYAHHMLTICSGTYVLRCSCAYVLMCVCAQGTCKAKSVRSGVECIGSGLPLCTVLHLITRHQTPLFTAHAQCCRGWQRRVVQQGCTAHRVRAGTWHGRVHCMAVQMAWLHAGV